MKKNLLALLLLLFSTTFALPGAARAVSSNGDYVALHVPDLPQATRFFRQILNCEVLSGAAASGQAAAVLLDCGHGTIVELARISAAAARPDAEDKMHPPRAISLVTDNAATAAQWLRAHRIQVLGPPRHIRRGPEAGLIVVSFLTPWGQRLQLVSSDPQHRSSALPVARQLATQ
jgi:catechol 2,3-dioxygenase-like lactoylglutathione lyase family enzyme